MNLLIRICNCALLAFALSGCLIRLAGGHQKSLRTYNYRNFSRSELSTAMINLLRAHPELIPPERHQALLIHGYPDLTSLESQAYNSDSVQFHVFSVVHHQEVLYWIRIPYRKNDWEDWTSKSSKIALIGYSVGDDGMRTHHTSHFRRSFILDRNIRYFNREILPLIDDFLPCVPSK